MVRHGTGGGGGRGERGGAGVGGEAYYSQGAVPQFSLSKDPSAQAPFKLS